MEEDFEFKGMRYYVELELRNGLWCWWYKVNGRSLHSNVTSTVASRNIAISEAKAQACKEIEELLKLDVLV